MHMEGHESNESDPCQGKLQKDLDYAHISMYVVLVVKPAYICAYRFKSHVYNFSHVFRDGQGNIKGQKMVHGVDVIVTSECIHLYFLPIVT